MPNKHSCITEAQVLKLATIYEGDYLVTVARKIGVGHERLRKIAAKYDLKFRFRPDDYMSDDDLLEIIKKHQNEHSAYTIQAMCGCGWNRIKRIAEENGITLQNKRATPIINSTRYIDGYLVKICSKCREEKGAEYFYDDESAKCGFSSHCKKCSNERRRNK